MDEVQTLLLAEEVVIQERSRLAPTHHTHINTVINTVSASSRTLCDGAARPPDASFAHCLNRRVKTLLDSPENLAAAGGYVGLSAVVRMGTAVSVGHAGW
jgi:hypothetical protein